MTSTVSLTAQRMAKSRRGQYPPTGGQRTLLRGRTVPWGRGAIVWVWGEWPSRGTTLCEGVRIWGCEGVRVWGLQHRYMYMYQYSIEGNSKGFFLWKIALIYYTRILLSYYLPNHYNSEHHLVKVVQERTCTCTYYNCMNWVRSIKCIVFMYDQFVNTV